MRGIILVICLVTTGANATAQAPPGTTSDDAAIRNLVHLFTQARERSDAKSIEALLTADVDQYTSAGEWRRGRERVVTGMIETSARNPGARAIEIAAVRFIAADVAIVDGGYKTGADARQLWTTILVKRDGAAWKIAAIRNVSPTSSTR